MLQNIFITCKGHRCNNLNVHNHTMNFSKYISLNSTLLFIYIYDDDDDDDDDIEFISTKIRSCRPLRSCGKKIIIK